MMSRGYFQSSESEDIFPEIRRQVGCRGLQKIAVKRPKNIPPITRLSHPSRIYPGLALK